MRLRPVLAAAAAATLALTGTVAIAGSASAEPMPLPSADVSFVDLPSNFALSGDWAQFSLKAAIPEDGSYVFGSNFRLTVTVPGNSPVSANSIKKAMPDDVGANFAAVQYRYGNETWETVQPNISGSTYTFDLEEDLWLDPGDDVERDVKLILGSASGGGLGSSNNVTLKAEFVQGFVPALRAPKSIQFLEPGYVHGFTQTQVTTRPVKVSYDTPKLPLNTPTTVDVTITNNSVGSYPYAFTTLSPNLSGPTLKGLSPKALRAAGPDPITVEFRKNGAWVDINTLDPSAGFYDQLVGGPLAAGATATSTWRFTVNDESLVGTEVDFAGAVGSLGIEHLFQAVPSDIPLLAGLKFATFDVVAAGPTATPTPTPEPTKSDEPTKKPKAKNTDDGQDDADGAGAGAGDGNNAGELASTGSELNTVAAWAVAALILGGAAIVAARREHGRHQGV